MKTTSRALLDSLRPSPTRAGSIAPVRPHRWAHGTGLAVFLAFCTAQAAVPHLVAPVSGPKAAVRHACISDGYAIGGKAQGDHKLTCGAEAQARLPVPVAAPARDPGSRLSIRGLKRLIER